MIVVILAFVATLAGVALEFALSSRESDE